MVKLDRAVDRGDAVIAYGDAGGVGAVVVLVHGAGLDHTVFAEQAAALQGRGARILTLDLRGHGSSTLAAGMPFRGADALEDVRAILDVAEVRTAVLVGHSLGGNIAQQFAVAYPERLDGLIVIDSTWNAGPLSALERFGLRIASPILSLIPGRMLPRAMAKASAVTPAAVSRLEALFAAMPKRRFLEVWNATTEFVRPDPTARSEVPLGLVRGAADRTGNIAKAMTAWAGAEGVGEHVIPDAGHVVMLDAPSTTSAALEAILDEWQILAEPGESA